MGGKKWTDFMSCAPCDYYLLGDIKDIAYPDPPQTINELKLKIRKSIRVINEDILKRVFKNAKTLLKFVRREIGRRFEHNMT